MNLLSRQNRARVTRRHRLPGRALVGFGFCFLASLVPSRGQTVQVDRAQLTQTQAPAPLSPISTPTGIEGGQAVASPNDSDLGVQEVLKRPEEYLPWTASVSSPVYWTSNVALAPRGTVSDVITAPVAAVFYQPRITKTLYGFVDVRQQFFYYNHYNAFDFGSMDVEVGLSYVLPQLHNLLLRGEYDFNRLTFSDRVLDDFYKNHTLIFNAELPFRFSRALQFSLGADANISVAADHQSPRRNDYEVYAGYTVHITRALSWNAVGRVVVRDYHQNDRTDISEVLAVTLGYQLTDWWNISAIGTFANSDSNHDAFDYEVANLGGSLALSVKF